MYHPAFEHNFSVRLFKRNIVRKSTFSPQCWSEEPKERPCISTVRAVIKKVKSEYFENEKIVEPSLRSVGLKSGYKQTNKVCKFKQVEYVEVQIYCEFLLNFHQCRNETESVFLSLSQIRFTFQQNL